MPNSGPKSRAVPSAGPVGRPRRAVGHERKQLVVDTRLLAEAMRVTGRGQSETVNEALARLAENAAIVDGLSSLRGAYPEFPYDPDEPDSGAAR